MFVQVRGAVEWLGGVRPKKWLHFYLCRSDEKAPIPYAKVSVQGISIATTCSVIAETR